MPNTFARNYLRIFTVGYFVWFALVVFLSNGHDWDAFYSYFEVDRRAWLVNHEFPNWSYQLCGGISRLGDPQSYAYSPLFLPVLIFGSVIGAKFIVLISAFLGFFFLRKLLLDFAQYLKPNDEFFSSIVVPILTLLCIFQNWFVWNFHVGHVVYAETYLVFGPLYYFTLCFRRGLNRSETIIAAGLVWTILGGGLFPTLTYLLVPMAIVGLPLSAAAICSNYSGKFVGSLKRALPFLGLGLFLASFRFYFVWAYHHQFPRTFVNGSTEIHRIQDMLFYLLFPVIEGEFAWKYNPGMIYGIWEYSFFSIFPWLLAALTIGLLLNRERVGKKLPGLIQIGLLVYLGFTFVLAVGQFSELAPFTIIKKYLFSDAIRVPLRFLIGFTYALPFIALYLSSRVRSKSLLNSVFLISCTLGLGNFAPIDKYLWREPLFKLLKLPSEGRGNMYALYTGFEGEMYPTLKKGKGFLNCYQPLARSKDVSFEMGKNYTLLTNESESLECLSQSYFTQNKLIVSPKCSQQICVNVLQINPKQQSQFEFNKDLKKYCLIKRP